MSVRCFIAVDLSDEIRLEVTGLGMLLRKSLSDVRWVEPSNLHMTLRFLGELQQEQVQRIKDTLEILSCTEELFVVHFAGIGVFPNRTRPAIIWLGVDEGTETLNSLAERVCQACEEFGGVTKDEKIFFPHLTIGRLKNQSQAKQVMGILDSTAFRSSFYLRVDHLSLYRSDLKPEGPVYEKLFQTTTAGL